MLLLVYDEIYQLKYSNYCKINYCAPFIGDFDMLVDLMYGNLSITFMQLFTSKPMLFSSSSTKNGKVEFGKKNSGKLSTSLVQFIRSKDIAIMTAEIAIVDGANRRQVASTNNIITDRTTDGHDLLTFPKLSNDCIYYYGQLFFVQYKCIIIYLTIQRKQSYLIIHEISRRS